MKYSINKIYKYLRWSASYFFYLLKDYKKYVSADSYYPECILKSKFRIFFDQLLFIIFNGAFEHFYFLYGFDRKEMSLKKMNKYLTPYNKFSSVRDKFNYHPKYVAPYNYLIILKDKFYFERFLTSLNFTTPINYWFVNNSNFFNLQNKKNDTINNIFSKEIDAFVKPISGQCGEDIFHLRINSNKIYKNDKILDRKEFINIITKGNYLIQQNIKQHELINKIYSGSVNTIRLQTVYTNNTVTPFGAGIRFGTNGNIVDNWADGGVFVGININSGKLHKYGFLKPGYGTKITEHPTTKIIFEGYQIPFFDKAVKMAIELHYFFYGIHSIGWDIAITKEGPVFIEGNNLWEISLIQAAHGGFSNLFNDYFKKD